jgi:hypothetical protein
MSRPFRTSPGVWIAALLVVASIIAAFQSYRRVTFYQRQIAARQHELAELDRMRNDVSRQRAALDWINDNARGNETLATLIKHHLSGTKNDLLLRESHGIGEGWNIQQYDLRLNEAAPDKLGAFLAACENARPPVRILDIQVSPSPAKTRGLLVQLALAEITSTTPLSKP